MKPAQTAWHWPCRAIAAQGPLSKGRMGHWAMFSGFTTNPSNTSITNHMGPSGP